MKKFLYIFCLLLSATISYGQPRQKPPVKPAAAVLKNILSGSQLPFKLINDSLAVVPYGGENISSYTVIVQAASDLYIVSVNLSEALPGKMNESKFKYLLQRNNDFDLIKIGIEGDDNTVYLRADIFKAMTSTALLTRVIKQVANVANIIGGDMK
jgi:hypothetical protein